MNINKIKINSYGKLKNKEINLENNLNIIYGENESGKSTVLNFILNIFYGASKNKNGKEISDFEKYKPWDTDEFSGKLSYELDNKNKYEIFREFNKKNPKIFNEKGEDISKQFNIDKNKGNEFFYEQTQINEEMFLATSVAMQQEVKIGKSTQGILVQKISNLLGTGEDSISYKKAVEKLNKKQLEEIGTERSREKPINIVTKNIEKNEEKINELKKYENINYENIEEKNKIKNNLEKKEIKNNLLKEIKKIKEKNNYENEKIKIKEKIIKENKNKIKIIKNNIAEKNNNYLKEKNKNKINNEKNKLNKKIILFFILLILINILWFIFIPKLIKNNIAKYSIFATIPIFLIFIIIQKNKINKNNKKIEKNKKIELAEKEQEINNLKNEEKIIEKNNNELLDEINKIKIENNFLNNLEKEKIIKKYSEKINNDEINLLFNSEKINEKIELIENEINELKIELNKLEIKKENIEPQLENLSKIEEENFALKEELKNLQKNNESIELVKILLEKAYEKMKNNVSPIFTEKLSKNISKITNGKYSKIYFNDEQGLTVELDNGNYVLADRLSIGTIDQLYLSLRLAMLDELSTEKVPIILDEAFAYFDNERLTNLLKYMLNEYSDRQIIIFTCTKREKECLEKENIQFNFVEL